MIYRFHEGMKCGVGLNVGFVGETWYEIKRHGVIAVLWTGHRMIRLRFRPGIKPHWLYSNETESDWKRWWEEYYKNERRETPSECKPQTL